MSRNAYTSTPVVAHRLRAAVFRARRLGRHRSTRAHLVCERRTTAARRVAGRHREPRRGGGALRDPARRCVTAFRLRSGFRTDTNRRHAGVVSARRRDRIRCRGRRLGGGWPAACGTGRTVGCVGSARTVGGRRPQSHPRTARSSRSVASDRPAQLRVNRLVTELGLKRSPRTTRASAWTGKRKRYSGTTPPLPNRDRRLRPVQLALRPACRARRSKLGRRRGAERWDTQTPATWIHRNRSAGRAVLLAGLGSGVRGGAARLLAAARGSLIRTPAWASTA